jgi:hypothetical protein
MPALRSAELRGPDLMNCGRFPTTDRTFTGATLQWPTPGPLAQLVEQGTLNPKVAGSIPARPIERLWSGAFIIGPDAPRGCLAFSRRIVQTATSKGGLGG